MIKTLLINIAVGILPTTMLAQNAIPGYTINTSTEASTVSTEYGKVAGYIENGIYNYKGCLLYTSPSPRDRQKTRMPSSA